MRFLGQSSAAASVRRTAAQVAPVDVTLLLTGESGSGKGLLARDIHAASRRCDGPFVTVSCPVLPRDLLESELFGHEKGAFTGALRMHVGAFERAQGGTLFLDEVGDLPADLQPKLLTVLQDREYHRVGGSQALHANVRIIAATHVDLAQRVRQGLFREDLFYRLNVVPIRVPALRERLEDLPELCDHILARIAKARGAPAKRLTAGALEALRHHPWQGNVRELENLLERATLLAEGEAVGPHDFGGGPASVARPAQAPCPVAAPGGPGFAGRTLRAIECLALEHALAASGGNKAAAARVLGIAEKTIHNKLKRHRIGLPVPATSFVSRR